MRVFVTGATGFIGGTIARQLRDADHDVVALVRQPQAARPLVERGIEVAAGDLGDPARIRSAMQGADAVIHTAAWYKVGARDTAPAVPTNVDGTRHVLEAMRDLGIPRGVYTSTVGVHGDTHGRLVDESYRNTGPLRSHYERSKWRAHYEVALPLIEQGLPLVIVMPGLVYGPGDVGPTHDFMVDFLRRRLPMAPHRTAFSWGHVEDVAAGHLLALHKGRLGQAYHLTGPNHTMQEAVEVLTDLTGIPGPRWRPQPRTVRAIAGLLAVVERVVPLPPLLRSEVVHNIAGGTHIGDDATARRELGFRPRSLRDGMRQTVAWEMRRLGMPLPASLREVAPMRPAAPA